MSITSTLRKSACGAYVEDFSLEHVFSYWARMDKPQFIGMGAEGLRIVFPVAEGEVIGPKVHGRVLRGGGDWVLIRSDGIMLIDVRATVETPEGALIYSRYTGVGELGPEGYEKYLRRELPASIRIRAASLYECAHPKYKWLNRLQCLNVGEAIPAQGELHYDVYAAR